MTVAFNGAPARHAQTTNIYVFLMVLWSRVTDYQSINVISSDGGGKKKAGQPHTVCAFNETGLIFQELWIGRKGNIIR